MYKTTVRLYCLHWVRNSTGSRYWHRSMHGEYCHLGIERWNIRAWLTYFSMEPIKWRLTKTAPCWENWEFETSWWSCHRSKHWWSLMSDDQVDDHILWLGIVSLLVWLERNKLFVDVLEGGLSCHNSLTNKLLKFELTRNFC
jgi:hypothetical protein